MRALVVVTLAACSGAASPSVTPTVTTRIPVRAEAGVLSLDGAIYAFDSSNVTILRAGAVVATAQAPARWGAMAIIPAPDKTRWVVGVANAVVWRVTPKGEIEDVRARLGVAGQRVLSVAASRGTLAIGLEKGVLVSRDSRHAMHIDGAPALHVGASLERVAIGRERGVEILDLVRGTRAAYVVEGVTAVEFTNRSTSRARLVVSTRTGVLVERNNKLTPVNGPRGLRGIAVAGERVWMLGDGTLRVIGHRLPDESTRGAPRTVSAAITPTTRLHGAADGGVWLADGAALLHIALDEEDRDEWQRVVAPMFRRVCARCHLPAGDAGVDLSTAAAWSGRRDAIRRVLEERAMPPDMQLVDTDRAVIERWLDR